MSLRDASRRLTTIVSRAQRVHCITVSSSQVTRNSFFGDSRAPKGRTLLEIKIEPIDTRDRAVVYRSE